MPEIHPTSIIDSTADIAESVVIGPFCMIQGDVKIGEGTVLEAYVSVMSGTTLGERNYVAQGVILGGYPQDRKFNPSDKTYLKIGDENHIREYVTIHRATGEGNSTTLGDRNFIMANCHLGHNCTLHDDITMANSVGCSGHVTIESLANIGGMTGVHQFVRIGRASMVGGMSRITRDVPPFCVVEGDNKVYDINAVGLRRIGVTSTNRLALHKAVKVLFKTQLGLSHGIQHVEDEVPSTDEVRELIAFVRRWFEGKNGRGDQK